jgi:hypothetical protein
MNEQTSGPTRQLDAAGLLNAAKKLQKQLDEMVRELEAHQDRPVVVGVQPAEEAGTIPQIVDPSVRQVLIDSRGPSVSPPAVDLRKDPVSAYLECLQSLCATCGGTWNDGVDGRAAGCYFDSYAGTVLYALTASSCLPQGILKHIFS